jgi:hypothetical protein
MRRNQEINEPDHGSDRQRPGRDRDSEPDAHEPGDGDRITRPYPTSDRDDDDEDDYRTVVHRPNRLPSREADEEEVAEDDIIEMLDDDDEMFDDDLSKMEGPDA